MHEAEQIAAQEGFVDVHPLGEQGGMGTVLAAWDPNLQRKVAVKCLTPQHPIDEERFRREMRILANIRHPAVVDIHDSGQLDGVPYFVMDYIEGVSLKQVIAREKRPCPLPEVARLLLPVAHGLDTLHNKDIVHRDVKPANILVPSKDNPRAYPESVLVDFGISTRSGDPTLTGTNFAAPGTPAYSAPEQYYQRADARTDQYGLALVAYEMLTCRPFYAEHSAQEWQLGPRHAPHVHNCPAFVSQALARALSPDPRGRFASCQAFIDALVGDEHTRTAGWDGPPPAGAHAWQQGGGSWGTRPQSGPHVYTRPQGGHPAPATRQARPQRPAKRHRGMTTAFLAIVLILLVAGAGAALMWLRGGWSAEDAELQRAFPELVSKRPSQEGWLGLRCGHAEPLDSQDAVIACRDGSNSVVIADYQTEDNRERNVSGGDRKMLSNGICTVETTPINSDLLVLPTGPRARYAIVVSGEYAQDQLDSIPICPR